MPTPEPESDARKDRVIEVEIGGARVLLRANSLMRVLRPRNRISNVLGSCRPIAGAEVCDLPASKLPLVTGDRRAALG
jgi:hypothetical protein